MSDAFDPYHRWLGIPPDEQPPHHYRLLGINAFETDPEVIRDAVATADDARSDVPVGTECGDIPEDSQ